MNQNEIPETVFSEAFGFSEDDIATNREGKLSESQKKGLLKIYLRTQLFWSGVLLGLPLSALGLWVFVSIDGLNIILKIMILLVGLFLLFPAILQYIHIGQDIKAAQVTIKQSRIRIFEPPARGRQAYYILLNNHRGEPTESYDITAKQYELLNQNVNFRVTLYITPKSEIIVAMEKS